MKKILFIIFTPHFSGAEIVIKDLIQNNSKINSFALVGEDNENHITQKDLKTKYIQKLKRESSSFLSFIPKAIYLSFRLTFTILKFHRKYNFEIIHANNLTLASYGILTKIIFSVIYPKVEFIWHNHNINYPIHKRDIFAEYICNYFYSKKLVVSYAIYEKLKWNKDSTFVLHNGIDINLFYNNKTIRQQMRVKYLLHDRIVLGIFGEISEHKGQIELLKIINKLEKQNKLVHLLIIGSFASNKIRKVINEIIEELKLGRVTILKKVDNINDYYNLIDILINNTSASLSESLGLTILEGMSSEKIVIASNVGGTAEIINDGVDGFLFEPDNNEELEKKIEYTIDNIDDLNSIKKNARKKIIEKFTILKMVDSFNKIISNEDT